MNLTANQNSQKTIFKQFNQQIMRTVLSFMFMES